MSRNPTVQRPDIAAWGAGLIRVTLFPAANASVTADTWWKDVMGSEPSIHTSRKGVARQDQGEGLGGIVTLTVQPGRIDWTLSAKRVDAEPTAFPSVGAAYEKVPQLVDLLTRWLIANSSADRIALGLECTLPVRDHSEAYHVLDALLPAVEVDVASSDFIYRINRPQESRHVRGLQINRLVTWSAARLVFVAVTEGAQTIRSALPVYAVSAELDINTSAEAPGPLPMYSLPDILRDFGDMSVGILVEGDRA